METLKNYLEQDEYATLPEAIKAKYCYWMPADKYYLRYVSESVLNTFPPQLRKDYTPRGYNAAWNCAMYSNVIPDRIPERVTALAVDQAPNKAYAGLGVTYDDVSRNIRNFANIMRFLDNNSDRPDEQDLTELRIALQDAIDVFGAIEEKEARRAAKQPELELTPAASPCPEHGRGLGP